MPRVAQCVLLIYCAIITLMLGALAAFHVYLISINQVNRRITI